MRASGYDRAAADWYVEPAWIVDALLDVEPLVGESWDPACGGGNIPRAIARRGLPCFGSDVADRGFGQVGVDFFCASSRAANIVSNPPYGVIGKFIERSLFLTSRKVCILARLALLEGMKRREMFQITPLARVWVSSRRVSMPPGGTDIEPRGGSIAYAWFVWEHGFSGRPEIGWIG